MLSKIYYTLEVYNNLSSPYLEIREYVDRELRMSFFSYGIIEIRKFQIEIFLL